MLTEYFATLSTMSAEEAAAYTFDTFPLDFKWDLRQKMWIKRPKKDNNLVVRIDNVSPSNRELFVIIYYNINI